MLQKIKVFSVIFFYGLTVKCQTNTLVIFTAKGNPFSLWVNQNLINTIPQCNVKVYKLNIGWNFIEIKMEDDNYSTNFKDSILISNKSKYLDKELTYALIEKDKKFSLHFERVSKISGPKTPALPEEPKQVLPLIDNSIYGNLYQSVNNKPIFFKNFNNKTFSCNAPLSNQEIKYAINLMTKANDSETAYRYLTQIIDLNCYSTLQLKSLLEKTPIDMDRLNSAKTAYSHLSDPNNIQCLYDIFKYSAMKESFIAFIKDEENTVKQKKLQCKDPLDEQKFNDVYTKIKNTPYENGKLIFSKKILTDICLSSIQVKKISELYTHDREKIEYMKYASHILTDKENATKLAEEFQYQGTKDEYLKYITK